MAATSHCRWPHCSDLLASTLLTAPTEIREGGLRVVHLKSLTLKGFKSFASATTLRFEPGITAIVGPNGSGKSNVVDAMAWVLGEQGAKALRGGKMDDVIFAGTADRPPLGRAEVTLTIDNRDSALPIDFDEVSITRRMFRDGAGEYEINGKACRLLDIQELLSDSGIGREMHVIVSQGHLDAILTARPEDRRAFIEEAAGVLKHRKRKEKALRKLDAMQANLTRLTDLTGELRRQLGPLGRQAEVARRAAGVQADLRDARLRLLADDYATIAEQAAADQEAQRAVAEKRAALQQHLEAATAAGEKAAADVAAAQPVVERTRRAHFELSSLAERFRGTVSLAAERAKHLAEPVPHTVSERDPGQLEAQAVQAAEEQREKDQAVERAQQVLTAAVAARAEQETALAAAEAHSASAARAAADRREGLALLAGNVGSARSRLAAGEEEIDRLSTAIQDASERAARAQHEFDELRSSVGALDTSEVDLDDLHESALRQLAEAEQQLAALTAQERELSAQIGSLEARRDALTLSVDRGDGAASLAAAGQALTGLDVDLAQTLHIEPGYEAAIAAALGSLADALGVRDMTTAADALTFLKDHDGGRASLVLADGAVTVADTAARSGLPDGAVWAVDVVRLPDRYRSALTAALADTAVVADVASAQRVLDREPELRLITRDGDILSAHHVTGGSTAQRTSVEIQAAIARTEQELAETRRQRDRIGTDLAAARDAVQQAEADRDRTLAALHESDAKIAAVSQQLAELGSRARSAADEVQRLTERRTAAERAAEENRERVALLETQLAAAQNDAEPVPEPDPGRAIELQQAVSQARQAELDARLALRTAEERAATTAGAAARLRAAAASQRAALAAAEHAAQQRRRGALLAARARDVADRALRLVEAAAARAGTQWEHAESQRTEAQQAADTARSLLADLQRQLDELTGTAHSADVVRAQQELRLQQLGTHAVEDYAISVDDLLGQYGPQVPVPPSALEMAEYEAAKQRGDEVSAPIPMPYDRASTERRAKRAQRDFTALGKINPLALEEYAAMEERHAFLSTQLEDLTATRKDLLGVVDEVDAKILDLFTSAYHDVAAQFVTVFSTLFPGGEGSLELTDPDNMLATGIDVLARPPGKKVKRLSLLSGGERSLVAVAMLVAIFRARPSPFYVLDEVEAALDEVNLGRLVSLLRELRASSQLLVITHQKYTMDAADALYGVTMRGDGVSTVISQRLDRSVTGTAAPGNDVIPPATPAGNPAREEGHAAHDASLRGTAPR